MGTRPDVASRRSAPSGHVATTTLQRGPFHVAKRSLFSLPFPGQAHGAAWSAPPVRPSSINGKRGNARHRLFSGSGSMSFNPGSTLTPSHDVRNDGRSPQNTDLRSPPNASTAPPTRRPGRRCLPPRVDAGAGALPHAADPLHAVRPTRGDRLGAPHRVDLRRAKGPPASNGIVNRDFRFACPGWPLYTPEGRRAHETLFIAQSSSSRGRHLSPR